MGIELHSHLSKFLKRVDLLKNHWFLIASCQLSYIIYYYIIYIVLLFLSFQSKQRPKETDRHNRIDRNTKYSVPLRDFIYV